MRHLRRIRVAVTVSAFAVGLAVSACAGGGAGQGPVLTPLAPGDAADERDDRTTSGRTATATATATVAVEDFAFDPVTVEVSVGDRVRWRNADIFAHTVTSGVPDQMSGDFDGDLGELDSVEAQGATFEHTFDETGNYPYFCRLHPNMRGRIVVRP